jgi:catalase
MNRSGAHELQVIGANYRQIRVNQPIVDSPQLLRDRHLRMHTTSPIPSTRGTPAVLRWPTRPAPDDGGLWCADGEMACSAYTLWVDDDDWVQADSMVRDVLDHAEPNRLIGNLAGHLLNGFSAPVLNRAFPYWRTSATTNVTCPKT